MKLIEMKTNPDLKLKDGELYCDHCRGFGYIYKKGIFDNRCTWCSGEGKLNWIERIFGKENRLPIKEVDLSDVVPAFDPDILYLDYVDTIKTKLNNYLKGKERKNE